MYLTSIS
jgi:hypothetical protein